MPFVRVRHLPIIAVLAAAAFASPSRADTAVPAALTPAEQGWVERGQTALDQTTTHKARFLQIAPDGATTQGTAWLDRPGRMRFEYDKPSPLLLVANHGQVVFRDRKLDQVTTIPLSRTPLGLLLAPSVRLSGDVTVTGFTEQNGQLQITLERTAAPGDGSLTLIYSERPFMLRSWSVLDAQGRDTRVDLYDPVSGGSFPASLFDVQTNG